MKIANLIRISLLLSLPAGLLWAYTPSPEKLVRPLLDVQLEQAREDPETRSAVLVILRDLAEKGSTALTGDRSSDVMEGSGLPITVFDQVSVRAEVYHAIGRLGTPESINYLESLTADDFAEDETRTLWPAAQEALYGARLDQLSASGDQALFLENTIREYQDVIGNGHLANWAAEELCNRGALTSYPVVEQLLYDRNRQAAPENARFCEQRMRAVMSNPDRAAAIGSVLQVSDGVADKRLMQWAIRELTSMKSEQADQVMEHFEQQVLALPDGSPQKRELMPYADAIRHRNGMVPPRPRKTESR